MKHLNYYSLIMTAVFILGTSYVFAQKDTIEFESGKKKVIIVEKDRKDLNKELIEKNKEMFEDQIELAEDMIRKHEEMLQKLEEQMEFSFHSSAPDTAFKHYQFEFNFDKDLFNDSDFENLKFDTTFNEYHYKYMFKNVDPDKIDSLKNEIKIEFEDQPGENIEVIIIGDNDPNTEEIIRTEMQRMHNMHELDRLNHELQRHKMMIDLNEQKKRAYEESLRDLEECDHGDHDMVWIEEQGNNSDSSVCIEKKIVYRKRFNAHWAGFEFGLLNFINDKYFLANHEDMSFLEVIPERTFGYRLNVIEFNIPLNKYYFGLATGAGLEWNSIALAENINLYEDENHILRAENVPVADTEFKRNKFNSAYITVPLLFEFQIPIKYNKFYVRAGLTGSIRAWSKQKQIYYVDDQKYKNNYIDDFQLSPFRYGITTGIGYGNIGLFADYSLVPLIKEGHGPRIFPVTIGIHIIDF
jgi:hypothetical protein